MTDLFKRLMKKRGLTEDFLHPKYEDLSDPFELPDMEKAVSRMKTAADRGEKVIVYGDYDVDGVTATAEMAEILHLIGVKEIDMMLPNRFTDGYGMSNKVVQRAIATGVKLVVTVDCGSNNGEVVEALNATGVDVIITDHHELNGEVPKAVAVVNPKREDFRRRILERQTELIMAASDKGQSSASTLKDISSLAELCGAGVAFMVARACVAKGWIKNGREKWLIDLAMIGTVCDSMKLIGDNRIICYYGMVVLKKGARKGLKELIRVARAKEINTDTVAFQLGPRLNAAGRMKDARLALKLLVTQSGAEAAQLARELDSLNKLRQKEQEEATTEVAKRGVGSEKVLVVEGAWHEGVLGIIAGRLTETYKRPCFVISTETRKGSGRSFGDFNLALALGECQDLLEKGGGHAEACGLTVKEGKIGELRERVNKYYDQLRLKNQERFLLKNEDLVVKKLGELTLDFMEELGEMEPFGIGNAEPIFLIENAMVLAVNRMGSGEKHLNMTVRDQEGTTFRLIAFFPPEEWFEAVAAGERANIWLTAMVNHWRDTTTVEGIIARVERVEE